jgi:hypothetical protein
LGLAAQPTMHRSHPRPTRTRRLAAMASFELSTHNAPERNQPGCWQREYRYRSDVQPGAPSDAPEPDSP